MLRKIFLVLVLCLLAPVAYAAPGAVVLGTAANPPKGPGPGKVFVVDPTTYAVRTLSFAKPDTLAGNSFYAGYDPATKTAFIPSPIGRITMIDSRTGRVTSFPAIRGVRVARVVPKQHLLLALSAKYFTAYALSTHAPSFTLAVGGNAIAVNPAGTMAYVGGNMDRTVSEISLPAGQVLHTYPIARSGDLLFADGRLFSADIKTGVMSVLDVQTGKIVKLATKEVDPHFSYRKLGQATAGFMQLARSPNGGLVYAAGFSGHVLKFSTAHPRYLGQLKIHAFNGPEKLSGLAVLAHGNEALVTIENRHAAALVDMKNGQVVHLFKHIASNRWVVAQKLGGRRPGKASR